MWIEFSEAYSIYSEAWNRATAAGIQFCEFDGLDADGLIRCFGNCDVRLLDAMADELCTLLGNRSRIRITTARGTDIKFSNEAIDIGVFAMRANPRRISIVLPGQVSWSPAEESVEGRIVVDGILYPPSAPGFAEDPVELYVKQGRIVEIRGGLSASRLREWAEGIGEDSIYRLAHVSLGFHPDIRAVTGRVAEEERAFGSVDFGWGAWIDRPAPAHFDGSVLDATCWANEELILEEGRYVHPTLADLCSRLGVS
jgi:leucyl aminopeptidase (aminopeptidase T)